MNRQQFLIRSSLATAGVLLPFKTLFAGRPGNFQTLRRNVGIFTERGGTIGWLASGNALVVIDSQFPETAVHCLEGLKDKTSHSLDLLLNTHHHGDHTAGNPIFKPVARQSVAHKYVPVLMKKAAQNNNNDAEPAYPETTYEDTWKIDVGDETVHVRYFGRAHTAGDSVIYFEKANVVHMGDLIFNRMNPYTDRPAGASIHNWVNVLSSVLDTYPDDAIFIFGHGKPEFGVTGVKEDVKVMKRYLSGMIEHVEEGIAAGRGREEITDLLKLSNFENFLYADFWSLSQNLSVVYDELTSTKWLEIN